jgi:starvation-inducible DNA-binding protein
MYTTGVGIPEAQRTGLVKLLNASLAEAIDLALQAKQAHWDIKGPHFIALHELFDQVVAMAIEHGDNLAERAVQLGGRTEGTLQQVAKASHLKPFPTDLAEGLATVSALAASVAAYANAARAAIAHADGLGDPATADLYTQSVREADKLLWFLEGHLQSAK